MNIGSRAITATYAAFLCLMTGRADASDAKSIIKYVVDRFQTSTRTEKAEAAAGMITGGADAIEVGSSLWSAPKSDIGQAQIIREAVSIKGGPYVALADIALREGTIINSEDIYFKDIGTKSWAEVGSLGMQRQEQHFENLKKMREPLPTTSGEILSGAGRWLDLAILTKDAFSLIGNTAQKMAKAFESDEDNGAIPKPLDNNMKQVSGLPACGSTEHYSQIGDGRCGTTGLSVEDQVPFDGVWRSEEEVYEGMFVQVSGDVFALQLGKGMESCGTTSGSLSRMSATEIEGSFQGRCTDLNMKGKIGMKRSGDSFKMTMCVSMSMQAPGDCSLGYYMGAQRVKK